MGRGDLSDAEWELIGPLLSPEHGRWKRPAATTGTSSWYAQGANPSAMHERLLQVEFGLCPFPALDRTGLLGHSPANSGRSGTNRRLEVHDQQRQC